MGYLSQRKKEIRTNLTIKILLVVLAVISFLGFSTSSLGEVFNEYRFQIYLVLLLIVLFSLTKKFYLYATMSLLLLLLNFFVISSSMNIVAKDKADITKKLHITYQKQPSSMMDSFDKILKKDVDVAIIINPTDQDTDFKILIEDMYNLPREVAPLDSFIVSKYPVETSGIIRLSPVNTVAFATLDIDDNLFTFVGVDFSNIKAKDIKTAIAALEAFIVTRDEPVILVGDFNTVSWSKNMSQLLGDTGLYVKNPLLPSFQNLIFPPHFHVIAYRNLYFYKQKNLPALNNKFRPQLLKIGI